MSRIDQRSRKQQASRRTFGTRVGATLVALSIAAGLVGCGSGDGGVGAVLLATQGKGLTATAPGAAVTLSPNEELGKKIFFDATLSVNSNQSCATCHGPEAGWSGPDSAINALGSIYEGSIPGHFGNRKPPSSAYATASPILHYRIDKEGVTFVGGSFWDGRATGERLGNPAADQAQGPFLNPVEQALANQASVMTKICSGSYANLFDLVWGSGACTLSDEYKVMQAYDQAALSIAAYEASPESNAYTSKYDYYLKGMVKLTQQERLGLSMFKGKAKCDACHTLDAGPNGEPPLLTDFTFDNLGLPRNPDNPFYDSTFNPDGYDWVDPGLGGFLASRGDYQQYAEENLGKHKVPTLRNVGKGPAGLVKAYGHNGYFKSLKGIVHFYNTRDVKPRCADPFTREQDALAMNCWPAPEIAQNVNVEELGNLRLTDAQEDAIVAFMNTLSDGYQP